MADGLLTTDSEQPAPLANLQIPHIDASAWAADMARVLEQIRKFASLPSGWNYGSGDPLKGEVYRRAEDWLPHIYAAGLRGVNAFPLDDGGVFLVAATPVGSLEVSLYADSKASVLYEVDGADTIEFPYLENAEAVGLIAGIAKALCAT